MNRSVWLIALVICCVFSASAQKAGKAADQKSTVEAVIAKLEKENNEARVAGSRAVLNRLYADDFAGVTAAGTDSTKQDILTFYADPEGSPIAVHDTDKVSIRVSDKTAIVTARLKYQYNEKMSNRSVNWMRYTRVYVYRTDKWQVIAEHFCFLKDYE